MSNGMLPNYLKMASPNPAENRAPWYKNTAPTYAGIFLWVVFYMKIADGTLPEAGLGLSLLGLVVAALLCHFLFYLVPGLFGVKTGYPLYVVGSSTYGTQGGFMLGDMRPELDSNKFSSADMIKKNLLTEIAQRKEGSAVKVSFFGSGRAEFIVCQ